MIRLTQVFLSVDFDVYAMHHCIYTKLISLTFSDDTLNFLERNSVFENREGPHK